MKYKLAKLRFESKDGSIMLSKLTDIETGAVIPIRSIKIEANVEDRYLLATVQVYLTEIEIDGIVTKFEMVRKE